MTSQRSGARHAYRSPTLPQRRWHIACSLLAGARADNSTRNNDHHDVPRQRIVRERRQYNQWVASQTLEDYALRYTADRARKSSFRVGNTAFGPIAFLACEAIGGALTIAYGFPNTAWAVAGVHAC